MDGRKESLKFKSCHYKPFASEIFTVRFGLCLVMGWPVIKLTPQWSTTNWDSEV